jgi:hypothetical protein
MNVVGEYLGADILHSWIGHDVAVASLVKAHHDVPEPLVDAALMKLLRVVTPAAVHSSRRTGPSYLR